MFETSEGLRPSSHGSILAGCVVMFVLVAGGAARGLAGEPGGGAAERAAGATAAAAGEADEVGASRPGVVSQGLPEVERLADDVYLFSSATHRSLFVVTPAGVLVTDPQNPEAAARYADLVRGITDAPVRYLVYSHHHADHAAGGGAFGEDVTVVAHESVREHLQADDGIVRPAIGFRDRATIYLGDLEIRLIYPGPSETESNIIVHVPARGVAFMVDAVSVRTLPWRDLGGADPRAWVAALNRLDALDFAVLAPGHGPSGRKSHVRENIRYLSDLIDAVEERIEAGATLEQIQGSLELPQYADWVRYEEHFDLNVEGVYRALAGRQ